MPFPSYVTNENVFYSDVTTPAILLIDGTPVNWLIPADILVTELQREDLDRLEEANGGPFPLTSEDVARNLILPNNRSWYDTYIGITLFVDPSLLPTQAEFESGTGGGGGGGGSTTASAVTITDIANNFTATNVEGALAELATTVGTIDATQIELIDTSNNFTATTIEGALEEIATDLGNLNATQVDVVDSFDNFTSTTVEGALVELYDAIQAIPAGVTDHDQLTGRTLDDQHPISAITGLQGELDAKADLAQPNVFTSTNRPSYTSATTISTTTGFTYDPPTHGQVAKITLTNAITVTFDAPTNITEGSLYKLLLTAGDSASRTFAWNSAYKFPGAIPPLSSGSTGAGAVDSIAFIGGPAGTLVYDGHVADVR